MKEYKILLIEENHGYGGPGDGTSQVVGVFSSEEAVYRFMGQHEFKLKYPERNNPCIFCGGQHPYGSWYHDKKSNGLGAITYSVKKSSRPLVVE